MPNNESFSVDNNHLQIAWDSTSLSLLKTCPRKYYYSMIEQWQKKGGALPLTFGIFYHQALETYDKLRAEGADYEEAVRDTVRKALEISKDFKSDDTYRNRETLIRAITWYLDKFKDDPAKTVYLKNGKPAVELSFKMELPGLTTPEGDSFVLCGHMDRVVEYGDQIYVLDYKTTKGTIKYGFFDKFCPHYQMTHYTLASHVVLEKKAAGVIIDAVQLLVGGVRFARGFTYRTPAQLDEYLRDVQEYIRLAERYSERSVLSPHPEQAWPMNDTACDLYGGCVFRDTCKRDPSTRHMILKSDFEHRVWNPMEARE